MNPCTRRRRWTKVSAWIAVISSIAAVGNEIWIAVFATQAVAVGKGLAILMLWGTLACCSIVITVILRLTESATLAAILKVLNSAPQATPLHLVDSKAHTGR